MKKEYLYKKIGKQENINILFLHGYGQNKEMMFPLAKRVEKYVNVLVLDLPGSKNNPLTSVFSIDDYIDYLEEIILKENFIPDIIVGHSFGGKLATFYAQKHPCTLLLLAPSIIKPSFSVKKWLKIRLYKICKFLKNKNIIKHNPKWLKGSRDYENTSGIDRITFVKIVNSYLSKKELSKLNSEIFIVYGNSDQEIRYKQMHKLKKWSQHSHLIVIKGDHFAYLLNGSAISNLILEIAKEKTWK